MIQVTLSGDTRSTVSGDTSDAQRRYKEQSVVGDTRSTVSGDTRSKASDMSLRPRHCHPACHTCVVQWFAPPWVVVDVPVTSRVYGHTPSRKEASLAHGCGILSNWPL